MSTTRIASLLRRQINRIAGVGPWRSVPFSEIARDRLDVHVKGVHIEEDFTGILARESDGGYLYKAGSPLLGQAKAYEQLDQGPRYKDSGLVCPREKVLYSMSEAGVISEDAVVYCPRTRAAVRETLRSWTTPGEDRSVLGAPGIPRPRALKGVSLSLGTLSGGGYYHFLIEALPKLWLARRHVESIDHYLVTGSPGGFHERWLAEAGVPVSKIVWLDSLSHLHCEQVLFTGSLVGDQQVTPWTTSALRSLFKLEEKAGGSGVYWISRRDARERQFAQEAELLSLLPQFKAVSLSGMSPRAQIDLFASARVIAGPHGAGFANCAFCPPGGTLIELFPPEKMQPIYQRISQVSGMSYHWAQVDQGMGTNIESLAAAIRVAIA